MVEFRDEQPAPAARGGVWGWLEDRERALVVVARLAVPLVVAGLGLAINSELQRQDVNATQLGIAVQVLSQPVSDDTTRDRALREYAVSLLTASSPVALTDELRRQLTDGTTTLPPLPTFLQPQQTATTPDLARLFSERTRLEAAAGAERTAPSTCVVEVPDRRLKFGSLASIGPGSYEVAAIRPESATTWLVQLEPDDPEVASWLLAAAPGTETEAGAATLTDCTTP